MFRDGRNSLWKICIALLGLYHQSLAAKLRVYDNKSITVYTEADVNNPDSLITATNPVLDISRNTTMLIGGFCFDPDNGPMITTLIPTFLSVQPNNVILLNWKTEACDAGLGVVLGYTLNALPNSKIVGEAVGRALCRLVQLGLKAFIHVIGHSLGAQVAGFVGREAKKCGLNIKNITAIDPAQKGFEPIGLRPVDTSSAEFLNVMHCDAGGYGMNKSTGHVDLWFNYRPYVSGDKLQPGCTRGPTSPTDFFTNGNICSHNNCFKYYNESLTRVTAFKAGKASNIYEWEAKNGNFQETIFLGPLINRQARDDFFLNTASSPLWGLGDAGLLP